jgi:hypothetical protein
MMSSVRQPGIRATRWARLHQSQRTAEDYQLEHPGDGRLRRQPAPYARFGYDFSIVYDDLNGENRTTRNRLIPFCMFSDPEPARVGRNESKARRDGIE